MILTVSNQFIIYWFLPIVTEIPVYRFFWTSKTNRLIICYWSTAKDYGLFLADEDPKKGIWLEPGRNLGYYMLRSGVITNDLRNWTPTSLFILNCFLHFNNLEHIIVLPNVFILCRYFASWYWNSFRTHFVEQSL